MELFRIILISTIIIMIIFFLSNYFKNLYNNYIVSKKFVGPKTYPLIGNAYLFSGNMKEITNVLLDMFNKYSPKNIPIRLWLGLKLCIIIYQPDYMKSIFKNSYAHEKSYIYEFFKPFSGNGLFSAQEITWRVHRKILEPAFKYSLVKFYEDIIVRNVITLTKILDNFNGKEIDVLHHVHLCTLDVIYNALLKIELNLQNDPHTDLGESISCLMELAYERIFKLWLHPDIIYYNTSEGTKFSKCLTSIDNVTRKIMELNKKSLTEDQLTGTSTFGTEEQRRKTLLNLIFSKEAKYSEQNIRDEINTMVMAGSDTVAVAISFVFLMLATHPEIQNKVYTELYNIYGSSDTEENPVMYEHIQKIQILNRVINETLRLFPPGPFVSREMKEDVKVNDNLVIPKSSTVFMGIFYIHRSERYWKNSLKFDPDRFLPGNYDPDCFLPFSSGIRNCIGRTLAIMEMKILIASVLRKFIIQIDNPLKVEDIGLKLTMTLKPAKPIILRFKKR